MIGPVSSLSALELVAAPAARLAALDCQPRLNPVRTGRRRSLCSRLQCVRTRGAPYPAWSPTGARSAQTWAPPIRRSSPNIARGRAATPCCWIPAVRPRGKLGGHSVTFAHCTLRPECRGQRPSGRCQCDTPGGAAIPGPGPGFASAAPDAQGSASASGDRLAARPPPAPRLPQPCAAPKAEFKRCSIQAIFWFTADSQEASESRPGMWRLLPPGHTIFRLWCAVASTLPGASCLRCLSRPWVRGGRVRGGVTPTV